MKSTSGNNRFVSITIFFALIVIALITYLYLNKPKAKSDQQKIVFSMLDTQENTQDFGILEIEENDDESVSQNEVIIDEGQPIIAILIDNSDSKSKIDEDLPNSISIGLNPTIADLDANKSLIDNYDVLLKLPLESEDYALQDDQILLLNNSEKENLEKLSYILSKLQNNQGVYTSNEEKYTESITEAELLLKAIKNRDLIYLSGKQDKNSIIYQLAEKMSLYIMSTDIILDEIISQEAIDAQLLKLEEIARKNGSAVAMTSPYPLTIELIKNWSNTLEKKGIQLVSMNDFYDITKNRSSKKAQELSQ